MINFHINWALGILRCRCLGGEQHRWTCTEGTPQTPEETLSENAFMGRNLPLSVMSTPLPHFLHSGEKSELQDHENY